VRFHRYGRYGPDAWLYWRKRHLSQQRFLPVLASPTSVVIVQSPVEEERIITIVQTPNLYPSDFEPEEEEEEEETFSPSGQRLLGAPQDEQGMYMRLKMLAEFEAGAYFSRVEQDVEDRGKEWPLDEAVTREARKKAHDDLRQFVKASNATLDIDRARDFYIGVFVEYYQAQYGRATGDGSLPNEKTQRLMKLASLDARHDREQNHLSDGASEQELNVQAILRIQEVHTFMTGLGTKHVALLLSNIDSYKRPYREEIRRLARSESFPGSGGQLRHYPGI
jgi:hypothetical protein